jgi:pimeloyl-ACP methyl ester carboxylesterase
VHGFAGSAQQIESNAMRFVANGYPADRIVAYDHDGAGLDIPGYAAGLTEVVDDTLAEFDVEQVHLIGHSRGTAVGTLFLSDPAQAAKVARYVAIDGRPCPEPQVVPCIAPVQAQFPGQTHVEVATSKESFAVQYEFLVGEAPEVVDIVPQRQPVEISGRAVNFPANTGREATLDIWAIESDTGTRVRLHTNVELGPDGEFGPVELENGAHYEYALSSDASPVVHHLYLQPYVRSSSFVRLLSSEPDGAIRQNTNVGDDHTALVITRMREWHAQGDADVLELSVDDGEPVDVITDFVGNGAIGLHVHDDVATPGESTQALLPYFGEQPFQSGIDVHLPASPGVDSAITVRNLPRGDTNRPQTLNVPNWPSSEHTVSLVFADWAVDGA